MARYRLRTQTVNVQRDRVCICCTRDEVEHLPRGIRRQRRGHRPGNGVRTRDRHQFGRGCLYLPKRGRVRRSRPNAKIGELESPHRDVRRGRGLTVLRDTGRKTRGKVSRQRVEHRRGNDGVGNDRLA